MRILVSVRSVDEARIAARGGAGFIDLKEPSAGALGGLPVATIRDIVGALRADRCDLPVSATIGDLPLHDLAAIVAQVDAVGACGVDYVKVGLDVVDVASAKAVLTALATSPWSVVPVFIADRGVDLALVELACGHGFPAVMVDTADKRSGSLFEVMSTDAIERFIAVVRGAGALAGVAGALRLEHATRLQALAPDFAGFRSAVCEGERSGSLSAERLGGLVRRLAGAAVEA